MRHHDHRTLGTAQRVDAAGHRPQRIDIQAGIGLIQNREPRLAVLDETDSGLDIDALKIVANGVNSLRAPERAMILVTHYQRLLNYIVPDFVHVLAEGRIVKSGDKNLALELERTGYAGMEEPVGV